MYDHRNHCSNNGHILTIQRDRGRSVSLMPRPPWMDSVNAATSFGEMWEGLGAVACCELGEHSSSSRCIFELPGCAFPRTAEAQKIVAAKYSFCPHAGIIDSSPTSAGRLLIQVVTPWTTFQGAHRIYGLGAGLCHWFNHGQAFRPLWVHQVGATSSPGSFLIQHAVVKQVLNCNGNIFTVNASSAERFNFYKYSICDHSASVMSPMQ